MPQEMYDRIKEVLDANMATITTQIALNREIVSVKLAELKSDTEELKEHAKETNGQVKKHNQSILLLEEKQYQEFKRRRRMWALSLAAITTMFGGIMSYIIYKFSQ